MGKIKEELTPAHLRCSWGGCPAVYSLSDGKLLVIGKKPAEDLAAQIEGKVADDEFAVVLGPEFFQNLT